MPKSTWNRYFLGMALITSIALLIWIAGANAKAQSSLNGEWTATVSSRGGSKIQLNMERRSDKSGRNQMGQSFDFSDFQGLTREQAMNGGSLDPQSGGEGESGDL